MIAQPAGFLLGLWLMAAPSVLGYAGTAAADVHRWVGPFVAAAAVIAVNEVTRGLRFLYLPAAALLLVTVVTGPARVSTAVTAAALVAVTPYAGRRRHSHAGGWAALAPLVSRRRGR